MICIVLGAHEPPSLAHVLLIVPKKSSLELYYPILIILNGVIISLPRPNTSSNFGPATDGDGGCECNVLYLQLPISNRLDP